VSRGAYFQRMKRNTYTNTLGIQLSSPACKDSRIGNEFVSTSVRTSLQAVRYETNVKMALPCWPSPAKMTVCFSNCFEVLLVTLTGLLVARVHSQVLPSTSLHVTRLKLDDDGHWFTQGSHRIPVAWMQAELVYSIHASDIRTKHG
jgi:hypothetical protein